MAKKKKERFVRKYPRKEKTHQSGFWRENEKTRF